MLRPGEDEIRLDAVTHEGGHGNSAVLDLRVSQKATVVGRCEVSADSIGIDNQSPKKIIELTQWPPRQDRRNYHC